LSPSNIITNFAEILQIDKKTSNMPNKYRRPKMGYLELKQGSTILSSSVNPQSVTVQELHQETGFEVRFD